MEEALRFARSGDTIVVWRLDRLGRNMQHLIKIVNDLNDRGISFHSLQENITMDKASATGQLMFHLFAAFAEFERNLIHERSAAGRAAARARGRLGGRPEKLDKKRIRNVEDIGSKRDTHYGYCSKVGCFPNNCLSISRKIEYIYVFEGMWETWHQEGKNYLQQTKELNLFGFHPI